VVGTKSELQSNFNINLPECRPIAVLLAIFEEIFDLLRFETECLHSDEAMVNGKMT
jgi:hypothetical protein